jgi:Xaa-Pro dipeptidase
MGLQRRNFIKLSATSAALFSGINIIRAGSRTNSSIFDGLQEMTADAQPITVEERKQRVAKAQRLMVENNIQALILDSGTSLVYYTNIRWGASERTMVAIIPAKGEVKYVCPAFEADRFRELLTIGSHVKTWEEHESPYKLIVDTLKEDGITGGNVGIEEQLRFFIYDGIRKEAPGINFISGDPVTIPCRMIKSAAEIALMQKANDITLTAIKTAVAHLKEGMTNVELSSFISETQRKLGGNPEFALVNIAAVAALPHGSIKPQHIKKGDIVLMDCGCSVHGYMSDMTRTVVFGAAPTKRQREIWDLEKRAQAAGFAAAKLGAPCENVDIAARKVLTDAGFGPGYKLPGLPHRTGHGIGMDGHEWGNMVPGNRKLLEPGMCFSIEPMIVLPGEFGIRLEDCVYMTETGAKWFTQPSLSIDNPFENA